MEYLDIVEDTPSVVAIPQTKKKVKLTATKPGTMRALTRLWLERDMAALKMENSSDVLKSMAVSPTFSVREACILILNSYWKLKLIYPLMWRWWAYVRGFTEAQMSPIIREGKKKLPLRAHYGNMVFSMDMREDMMTMTKKQAEQYQAELLLAEKRRSLKTSPNTGAQGDSSSVSTPSQGGVTIGSLQSLKLR